MTDKGGEGKVGTPECDLLSDTSNVHYLLSLHLTTHIHSFTIMYSE